MAVLTKNQIFEEYKKCIQDKSRIYMIENYLTTFDATKNDTVPFKLFPRQKILLRSLAESINNVTTKPRQAGVSTIVMAKCACDIALADPKKPETILIIANNLDLSKEDLLKLKEFIEQLPRWFWGVEYYGSEENEKRPIFIKANEKQLILKNKSKAYSRSAGPNASRGISSVTRLIFDEAAFIEDAGTITSAISTTASSAKNVVYISTPHGQDLVYYPVYDGAKKETNGFKLSEFRWYQDPRYNKHLKWTKKDKVTEEVETIICPILNEKGDINYDEQYWESLIQQGYKPTSPWYEGMCNRYNHDKQKIAQELDVSFLGSAGTVVDDEIIDEYEKTCILEPEYVDNFYKETWIFKQPIEGHRYIMPIDASTGSGDDSSCLHILDIDAIDDKGLPCVEQVVEYEGKIQGDILAVLADQYGRYYGNAYAIIDCIGSSGDACALKMQALGYPNIYKDDENLKNVTSENPKLQEVKDDKQILGFRAGYLRQQILMNLEKALRFHEILPHSKRFVAELKTWVWKNGRPDHQSGSHDDTITSMAMGLFIYQFSIKRLEAVKEKNKAILNSMIMVQNAINGNTTIQASDKILKTPLPFFIPSATNKYGEKKQVQKEDPKTMLNKYLLNEMNRFMR